MVSDGKVSLEDGSSPLTRGKRPRKRPGKRPSGLIPAHAGKTTQWYADWPYCPAHPRSRGENTSRTLSRSSGPGSSPLTRGKHSRRRAQLFDRGLIPAHAGKTFGGSLSSLPMTAHPRSRGENTRRADPGTTFIGSSPLTRGKPARDDDRFPEGRLIPAHAGKTSSRWCLSLSCPAHPRSRGENPHPMARQPCRRLAHPRSRGENVEDAQAGDLVCWLIPAHAGKTGARRRSVPRGAAHPRSRGENFFSVVSVIVVSGSSPLTRGKPAPYGPATMPASGSSPLTRGKRRGRPGGRSCVLAHPRSRGENGGGLWFPRGGGAHPRSRGENKAQQELHDAEFGSSPLTRGKLMLLQQVSRRWGLIPAHAGKTCLLSALA